MVPGGGFCSVGCSRYLCTLLEARILLDTTTHFDRQSGWWCPSPTSSIGDEFNLQNVKQHACNKKISEGRYELNKLTSLPVCGFTAQLVEHRTSESHWSHDIFQGHHGDWCLQRYSQQINKFSSPKYITSINFNLPQALLMDHYHTNENWLGGTLSSNFQNIWLHPQRDCYIIYGTSIWIRTLFFILITVPLKSKFTDLDNYKIQSWLFVFLRTEDSLNNQDLNKRMTDCGNITTLRQHCIMYW